MKILVIAQKFPPAKSARAAQMGKVARLLSDFGWEARVVAGLERGAAKRGADVREISPFPIEYVESFFSDASFWGRAASKAPDVAASIRFARRAAAAAKRIVDRWRPDCLLTVSTPFASHWAGTEIRRAFPELPWAAFFSDPYPSDLLPGPYFRRSVDFPILKRRVRRVLEEADGVFLTSRFAAKPFEEGLGVNLSEKLVVAPHVGGASAFDRSGRSDADAPWDGESVAQRGARSGFDADDFSKRLVYAGSVGPERALPELLEAVRDVAERSPEIFRGLLVFDKNRNAAFRNLAKRLGCERYVRFEAPVSPNDAFRIAQTATCNATVEANLPFSPFFPSKFADCVAANRPILAITPNLSEISYLTNFCQCCAVVRYDKDDIGRAVERIFRGDFPNAAPNERLRDYFLPEKIAAAYRNGLERTIQNAASRRRFKLEER